MGYYSTDMLGKAKPIYLRCPFCGSRDWLKVRTVEWMNAHGEIDHLYSIHCLSCHMVYGEEFGAPLYESESALIADWNKRAY